MAIENSNVGLRARHANADRLLMMSAFRLRPSGYDGQDGLHF